MMTLILKILGVIGWILLAILLLLVWIIVVPRHFYVEYSKRDNFILKMDIAFWKVPLFPLPKFLRKRLNPEEAEDTVEKTPKEKVSETQPIIKQPETAVKEKQSETVKSVEEKPSSEIENKATESEKTIRSVENKTASKTEKTVSEPKKKKSESVKKSKKEKVKKEKKKKSEPLDGDIEFSFSLVKQVVSSAKGIMKRIFKAIKFRDVSFTIPIYDEDPFATQKKYAAATNGFYALSIFLQKNLQFYYKSPIFIADFANQHADSVYFYCKISASPILLLVAAFYAYRQYKSIMKNNTQVKDSLEKENNHG